VHQRRLQRFFASVETVSTVICYNQTMIPTRILGKTGVEVTTLGLGGEGILRTFGHENEAYELINRALDLGITYFESARAYAGSEFYYGKALKERRKEIFLTSKSHARDKRSALIHLEETLKNMNTDHLDLWQVHDVRSEADVKTIFGSGGAIEAFAEAKQKGLTRFIGVTGHHDPIILGRCIKMFDFDTVLLPVNPAEMKFKSFLEHVLPLALKKNMGIVGMKVYFHGFAKSLQGFSSLMPFMNFALSQPIATVVIGCDDTKQLQENVNFACAFKPMRGGEMEEIIRHISPFARELMHYKPQ
jgi:predicted aldo/keto reductase-like oxidoreductase